MSRFIVMADWNSVPHLTEQAKADLLQSIPPFQRDARSKGIPMLGAGAIYPVAESEIVIPDFPIPEYWPRAFGMDVGWNRTAAVWGAQNPTAKVVYLYHEYYKGEAEPAIHAQGIKAPGAWIKGRIDPASRGRSQVDGKQLIQEYRDLGLLLEPSRNTPEASIYVVWQMLSSGTLKVFESLRNWISEYRLYRRDEKGHIVKESDHLQNATHYLCVDGISDMYAPPSAPKVLPLAQYAQEGAWML